MEKYIIINSPLDQFEIRNLFSIDTPLLGTLNPSLTNIGLYLLTATFLVFFTSIITTNYSRISPNKVSLFKETLYATIHSIVVNQINNKNGQVYFPFMYTLFVFILVNNLIGMVKRSLCILLLFNSNMFEVSGLNSNLAFQTYSSFNSDSQSDTQINISKDSPRYSFNNKNTSYLNPDYITGFVDGEGCFSLSIFKDRSLIG
jgi:hypothetical protein